MSTSHGFAWVVMAMSDGSEPKYGDFGDKWLASWIRNYERFDCSKVKVIARGGNRDPFEQCINWKVGIINTLHASSEPGLGFFSWIRLLLLGKKLSDIFVGLRSGKLEAFWL